MVEQIIYIYILYTYNVLIYIIYIYIFYTIYKKKPEHHSDTSPDILQHLSPKNKAIF